MTYLDGLIYAENNGHWVQEFESPLRSFSIATDDFCAIAINPTLIDEPRENIVILFHELGHCETGSFYNQFTPYDIRQKHENRADRWAINKLIPKDEFNNALDRGLSEIWELADHFNVTEQFMKKAVCFYTYGNVAADLYF